jgi:hypothetical protein
MHSRINHKFNLKGPSDSASYLLIIRINGHDNFMFRCLIKEDLMKTLFIVLSLMFAMVSCNKDAKTEYKEQRMEANKDYREDMKDVQKDKSEAIQDRNEELQDANKEFRDEKRDEAED